MTDLWNLNEKENSLTELSKRIPHMENEEKRLADAERAVSIEQLELQYTESNNDLIIKAAHLNKYLNGFVLQLTKWWKLKRNIVLKKEENQNVMSLLKT